MEPNPYEAPDIPSDARPGELPRTAGSWASRWKWVCLAGFSLALLGWMGLPSGPIGPAGALYLLGCLACTAVGCLLLLLGAVGWLVHGLRSDFY